jgi:hypothetical protein
MRCLQRKLPWLALGVLLGSKRWAVGPVSAWANERATLAYQASATEGAQVCPTADQFAEAVSARLGYDPFVAPPESTQEVPPPQRVTVAILRQGRMYTGQLSFRGERTLTSEDCQELGRSLALAVALRLDPERAVNPGQRPPVAAMPTVVPSAASVPSMSPASAPAAPMPSPTESPASPTKPAPLVRKDMADHHVHSADDDRRSQARPPAISAQVLGTLGDTPSTTLGFGLGGELGLSRHLFFALDLSATLPSRVRVRSGGDGTALGNLNRLGLGACAEKGPLVLCAVGAFGLAFVTAEDVAIRKPQFAPYLGLGLRPALNLALSPRFGLRIDVEGMVNLVRSDLQVNAVSLFRTWPVSVRLGLGPVWRFP